MRWRGQGGAARQQRAKQLIDPPRIRVVGVLTEPGLHLACGRGGSRAQPAIGQHMAMQAAILDLRGLTASGLGIAAGLEVEDPAQPGGIGWAEHWGQARQAGWCRSGHAQGNLVSDPLRAGLEGDPAKQRHTPQDPAVQGARGVAGHGGIDAHGHVSLIARRLLSKR
jgi:hypothetical protein